MSGGCLQIKKLGEVDQDVLEALIENSPAELTETLGLYNSVRSWGHTWAVRIFCNVYLCR